MDGIHRKSFADVGYDEALRRAESLIPLLKQHASESERLTHMAPAVLTAFHESGLFRYMQPRRWGGMELDFVAVFDIPEMLGRGDASAAWTFTNLSAHHRLLALWDPKAQEEIWGDNPDMLIASGIAPLIQRMDAPRASIEQLELVHPLDYIEQIQQATPSGPADRASATTPRHDAGSDPPCGAIPSSSVSGAWRAASSSPDTTGMSPPMPPSGRASA